MANVITPPQVSVNLTLKNIEKSENVCLTMRAELWLFNIDKIVSGRSFANSISSQTYLMTIKKSLSVITKKSFSRLS